MFPRSASGWTWTTCSRAACDDRAASCASRRSSSTSRPTRTSGRRPTTGRSTTCLRSQDEIAASVGRALQVELAGDAPPGAAPATVEAYDLYLQGQFLYHRRSEGDIERAIDYYRKAVEISPEFARAWAALAGAYSLAIGELYGNAERRAARVAGRAALKAVELEPDLAVAHARLGQYYYQTDSVKRATSICASLPRSTRTILSCSDSRRSMPSGTAISTGPRNCGERPLHQDPLSPTIRGNYRLLPAPGRPTRGIADRDSQGSGAQSGCRPEGRKAISRAS